MTVCSTIVGILISSPIGVGAARNMAPAPGYYVCRSLIALSRALPRWARISTVDDPDAYVRRMVVNAHVSRWRTVRRREVPVEVVHDRPAPPGMGAEDRDRLWRACRALPTDQRTAVVLRFYEDLDYAEIAALTGVREGSVRSRVSRGIAAMRHELGEDDDE